VRKFSSEGIFAAILEPGILAEWFTEAPCQ